MYSPTRGTNTSALTIPPAADDFSEFTTEYGHSDAFSLSDVLWTCSTMLATR